MLTGEIRFLAEQPANRSGALPFEMESLAQVTTGLPEIAFRCRLDTNTLWYLQSTWKWRSGPWQANVSTGYGSTGPGGVPGERDHDDGGGIRAFLGGRLPNPCIGARSAPRSPFCALSAEKNVDQVETFGNRPVARHTAA
jgi:hypothetical protein